MTTDRLDPDALLLPWSGALPPYGIVDLDRVGTRPPPLPPPFPLLGIGDGSHPWAAAMDVLVEPPVSLEALAAGVRRAPLAAQVAVQTLRLIDGMPPAAALVAESLAYGLLQGGAEHQSWLAGRVPARPTAAGQLRLVRDEDRLTLTLDRPAARNAIDVALRDALHAAFEFAALDDGIAAVELGAVGRTFSIGADLAEFGTTRDPAAAHAIRMATLPALAIVRVAERLSVRIDGACIGAGLELAAFARRVVATPRAWFQLPELAMGLILGAGGCVSLSRRIGRQRTALLLLSGRRIDAATALRWGLVDALVD